MDDSSMLSSNSLMDTISPSQPEPMMGAIQPPPSDMQGYWKPDNSSVNAVSFGFVATAVLISLFLIVAIFEKLLRRPSLPAVSLDDRDSDVSEAPVTLIPVKREDVIIESRYTSGFSVLMPGQEIPTFIANPAPIPCHREGISWAAHDHGNVGSCSFGARSTSSVPIKFQEQETGAALV